MTDDEKSKQNQLREQFLGAKTEARFYRGLFWVLLALAGLGTIVHLLQK